jgi:DNA-binding transcriptional MerR regulator
MAAKKRSKKSSSASGELLTLSEVSKRTGISMPTLQRYKKLYQERIPSQGEGRKQRYPEDSLPVFEEIKKENIGKRGRPRKSASAKPKAAAKAKAKKSTPPPKKARVASGRKAAASKPAKRGRAAAAESSGGEMLTMNEISKRTGISYPTLVRYKKMHLAEIPHEGKGRGVRFHPEAVDVFLELRGRSSRGPRRKGASAAGTARKAAPSQAAKSTTSKADDKRLNELEKAHAKLQKRFDSLVKKLKKPLV